MPPKGKLKDEEIAALTEWVKRGRIWPAARPGAAAGTLRAALREHPPRRFRLRASAQRSGHSGRFSRYEPGAARGQGRGVASFGDRPVHPRQARGEQPGAGTRGRQADIDPSRLLRSDRATPLARRGRRVRR